MGNPVLFIGSSAEGLPVARAIKAELEHDAKCIIWNQNFFGLNLSTLEGLLEGMTRFDFGIFVFSPDDRITIRGEETWITRDNVIFEFGLFLSQLGRQRAFVVRSSEKMRVLSDLSGVTVAYYQPVTDEREWQAAVGTACNTIRGAMTGSSLDWTEKMSRQLSPTLLYVARHVAHIGEARRPIFFRKAFHHFLNRMGEPSARLPLQSSDGWDKAADYAFRYLASIGVLETANSSEYIISKLGKAVLTNELIASRYARAFTEPLQSLP